MDKNVTKSDMGEGRGVKNFILWVTFFLNAPSNPPTPQPLNILKPCLITCENRTSIFTLEWDEILVRSCERGFQAKGGVLPFQKESSKCLLWTLPHWFYCGGSWYKIKIMDYFFPHKIVLALQIFSTWIENILLLNFSSYLAKLP